MDDPYLHVHTFSTFEENVNATVDLLQFPGFTIQPAKSVLVPTQEIEFLGFALKSVEMKIRLCDYKAGKAISKIKKLLYEEKQTIRDLASVIVRPNFSYCLISLVVKAPQKCKQITPGYTT